ncbi:hypothetical protein SteCoe_9155 [Stentor coeruleus]|uniref:Protein transport protein Sec61 subunit beta n=1 Tax=Stentor coeruleus TaxID=5963 RepID=A0A1R2C494_9CILI|nr:hypothetical protein SteCoe_15141 [Stentor coeruleus]OMJ88850.1 hypothetical protein SteCoe_9155 [Stentor coeruleus]
MVKGGQTQSAIESAQRKRGERSGRSANYGSRGTGNAGELKLYSEDAPGLQIGPSTVLLLSLSYIAIVVILHIVGKLRG